MVNREGIEAKKSFLFFSNYQLIIILEVIVQLEENLKARLERLWGHTIQLLYPMLEIGIENIPSRDRVFTGKDAIFAFLHDGCEGPVFPGSVCSFIIVVYYTSLSLFYIDKTMLP